MFEEHHEDSGVQKTVHTGMCGIFQRGGVILSIAISLLPFPFLLGSSPDCLRAYDSFGMLGRQDSR